MKLTMEITDAPAGPRVWLLNSDGEPEGYVTPELAEWIRAKAAQEPELDGALVGLHGLLCDEDLDEEKLQEASEGLLPNICDTLMRTKVIFGSPLTEDCEIEI